MSILSDARTLPDAAAGRAVVDALGVHLAAQGITTEDIGRLSKLGGYQQAQKDNDGNAVILDLWKFELSAVLNATPDWPVVQPGPVVRIARGRATRPVERREGSQVVLVLPDMQAGFYRARDGELVSIHHRGAIDVVTQIASAIQPTMIVALGDNLDLPEMSRFRLSPAFQQTMQPAIDEATLIFARLRATCPDAKIVWLAGNHEERLSHYIMDNAAAAFGLRQGMTPEGWPVMSVPHLCQLDASGVEYRPGYPAADIWLTDNLRIIHGDRVKSKGSTAHVYLNEQKSSVIYGHIHRIERAHRTRQDHDGVSEIMAASPGCLARIDGVVPSTGQGLDLDGRPLPRCEDWQTGAAVVTIDADGRTWDYEQIRVDSQTSEAWYRGSLYRGTDEPFVTA